MKELLDAWFPGGSTGRWVLSGFRAKPVVFAASIYRSLVASYRLTGNALRIKVRLGPGQTINVARAPSATVEISGTFTVQPWGGSNATSSISCAEGSTLIVGGDFEIGPGIHIVVGKYATLVIGGRKNSTGSGITCNSRIMVEKSVAIGVDTIIAWDVVISDSDWHDIHGVRRCEPVVIGDNVWISHGVSIVKGAQIPSGCIVGAKSLVSRGEYPERALIAGVPATVRRTEVEWSR